MKKFADWMNTPVTWGGYLKLATICTVIGSIYTIAWYVVCFEPTWWTRAKKFAGKILNIF